MKDSYYTSDFLVKILKVMESQGKAPRKQQLQTPYLFSHENTQQ